VVKVPLELDRLIEEKVEKPGLSYQAIVREALALWLETREGQSSGEN